MEGRPALGAAHGTGAREYLHGEHTIFGQSMQWIVTRGWKYVWWSDDGHEQLFDLSADPLGERDLAAAEPHREQLQRCRGYLVESLRDREEGFVSGGELVPGRPVTATLAAAHGDEITGHGPS